MTGELRARVRTVRANPIYRNVVVALSLVAVLVAWSPFHDEWIDLAVAVALVVGMSLLGWLDVRDARRDRR